MIQLHLKPLFISIFSLFLISCMQEKSGFTPSSSGMDTSTGDYSSVVKSNPSTDEEVENNSNSLKTFLTGVYEFISTDLLQIVDPTENSLSLAKKREKLINFKSQIDASVTEYEELQSGLRAYKEIKETQKTELNCGETSQKSTDQTQCDDIEESIRKTVEHQKYAETYFGCYLEKIKKFNAPVVATLNSEDSQSIGVLLGLNLRSEFDTRDLTNIFSNPSCSEN